MSGRYVGALSAASAFALLASTWSAAQDHAGHEQETPAAPAEEPSPPLAAGHEGHGDGAGGMSHMQECMAAEGGDGARCPMMQEQMSGAASGDDAHAGHSTAQAAEEPHAGHVGAEGDHACPAETTTYLHGDNPLSHLVVARTLGGALGCYPLSREASGTAWSPDTTPHGGVHGGAGGWDLMGHVLLNGVYDWQDGPRGDEKAFVSGMIMGSARRPLGEANTLQLRAMLSPDPFMGESGYPLLLASGETADGAAPLVDRQHPHDLFMELSASLSRQLTDLDSIFVYAGLPGEPAFGPPAFMHRASILDSPEAPIGHHWLDSTHITFGVVTAGWVHDDWKIEASRFRGREPDENRFDIETGALDSTAARLSWNPAPEWSLQASWADVTSPEQLEPDEDAEKWSASAIYTHPLGEDGWWSTTLAWGRRSGHDDDVDAFTLESAVKRGAWTVFARAERTENPELELGGGHGEPQEVGKASIGAIRDFRLAEHVALGFGGLYAVNVVPDGLDASYDGDPAGAMAFVRLKIE